MKTKFLIILVCIFTITALQAQPLPVSKPEKAGMSSERLERIDTFLADYIEQEKIAGAVTCIARHGKLVHYKAFGNMDKDKSMQKETIFRIASMTKPVTAVATMMLFEEGRFLLSDPIEKYLPEFAGLKVAVPDDFGGHDIRPAKTKITIKHLLNHTSGYSYGAGYHKKLYKEKQITGGMYTQTGTVAETLQRLSEIPLICEPGEEWHYSMSIDILGRLVEVISGQDLETFFVERIFEPLKMTDTRFCLSPEDTQRVVRGYKINKEGKAVPSARRRAYLVNRTYFSGGTGLVSTAHDYMRFAQMLCNGGELDGVRILGPKTLDIMTTNTIGDLITHVQHQKFGLGFGVVGLPDDQMQSMGSFGWDGAGYTRFWVDPQEDLVGIIMQQLGGGWVKSDVNFKFRVLVYQSIVGE